MTALLRNYTHDGRTTLLLDGRALYLDTIGLTAVLAGSLAETTIADDRGWWRGTAEPSADGSRVWFVLGPARWFCWRPDLRAYLAGEAATAPLHPVYDSSTVPALASGRPLHA